MVNRLNGNQTKIIRRTSCRQNGIRPFWMTPKSPNGHQANWVQTKWQFTFPPRHAFALAPGTLARHGSARSGKKYILRGRHTRLEREKLKPKREGGRFCENGLKSGDFPPKAGELEFVPPPLRKVPMRFIDWKFVIRVYYDYFNLYIHYMYCDTEIEY